MSRQRSRVIVVAIIVLSLVGLAGPLSVVRADCPGNVLRNGGFEEGFTQRGVNEVVVAIGWTPWWQDGPFQSDGLNHRPEYQPEDASRFGRRRVREGNFSQKWHNTYATHHAGIYQQVNVPPGSLVTLRAWAQAWSSSESDPNVSKGGRYFLSVGIDPTGGTDWSSPNVIWSPRDTTLDQWVELTVQARAQGGTVTAYLRGDAEFRMKHNDAYFDDVCLTYVAPTPEPTNTPRPTLTPLPTDTPSPTDTPTPEPTDTPSPTDTPTPLPTDTPRPTDTPTPEPTDTPSPADTPTPEPTAVAQPTATPLPPTPTPTPTGGALQGLYSISGILVALIALALAVALWFLRSRR